MTLAERLASLVSLSTTEQECYAAGWSSVVDGPNTENCHFRFFGTRERTNAWERGVADAKLSREGNGNG